MLFMSLIVFIFYSASYGEEPKLPVFDAEASHKYLHSAIHNVVENDNLTSIQQAVSKATVQFISKKEIALTETGYLIPIRKSPFCKKNPFYLENSLGVEEFLNLERMPAPVDDLAPTVCSGVLALNQNTIITAGHCIPRQDIRTFCSRNVIVFHRFAEKIYFSEDEIFECAEDQGEAVFDVEHLTKEFNQISDDNNKDHAFLKLKRVVPSSTALALQMAETLPPSQEPMFCLGYPLGETQKIHSMTLFHIHRALEPYGYISLLGTAFEGNSGGPCVNSKGQVLAILSSADDNKYGDQQQREIPVRNEEGGLKCTEINQPGPIEIVGISLVSEELQNFLRQIP